MFDCFIFPWEMVCFYFWPVDLFSWGKAMLGQVSRMNSLTLTLNINIFDMELNGISVYHLFYVAMCIFDIVTWHCFIYIIKESTYINIIYIYFVLFLLKRLFNEPIIQPLIILKIRIKCHPMTEYIFYEWKYDKVQPFLCLSRTKKQVNN